MTDNQILTFFKQHKFTYTVGIIFMILSSYVQALFPKILGKAIDLLSVKTINKSMVFIDIFYIALISIGSFVFTFVWRNLVIGNARKLECDLREKLFLHFQKMSPEFYSERKTGDLIAYAINDISAVRMTFGPATALAINGIVLCIVSIYSMCNAIDLRLTLITLLPIPFIVIFTTKIGKIIKIRFRRVQENFSNISDKVQENIYGIRVIKAYVQESSEIENFETLNKQISDSNLSMVRASSLLTPVIEVSFSISFVMNLIIGGNMVLQRKISLGDFVAFNSYLTMIMNPIVSIGRVINVYQRGMASLGRLNDIFKVKPQIKDALSGSSIDLHGNIEFKDFDFIYPAAKTKSLNNINLKLPKGHTLGIIGKTGSGKTTLATSLFKLYNLESGKVFIDGKDINTIPINSLRTSFAIVPQDNFLFSDTIKNNISFFKDIYSQNDLEEASKNSLIYESILGFKDGFECLLGERGVNLSGGQKQRVSIARALIKNPSVLILDDSLSAVDTITEKQVLHNLKKLRMGKTNIIIAHRISAVAHADEIIVLDKGSICERGTHTQLIKERGLYYEIYNEQCADGKS
ncbi:ABC transporter ATP-binding protein [Clostridium akagii]|uniref:ABC transporter ATP-binding protein n=1 Tax=Clostridium akagii TaxID=91623 RepID=UPI00047DCE14|nr:ABC transporter ATP-binding protein [Clostridium akagii]